MNTFKTLLFNRFKTISILTISITFSMVLLMVRMKLSHSFFLLFLVCNLFLAVVPFAISTYLTSNQKLNKTEIGLWFCVWLLFLPNAPYIITDLLHLKMSPTPLLWLDVLVVSAFALNGLLIFFLSLIDMESVIVRYLNKKYLNYLFGALLFLCGFGVYLGRFLRYNSWEILQNPIDLISTILNIIFQPHLNAEAWLFTSVFGTFLSVGYWIFKTLLKR